MNLRFKKFNQGDFDEYRKWFQDPDLNKALGPGLEHDWLNAILEDMKFKKGCHWSVFLDSALVGVVGVTFATTDHLSYYITEMATKPTLRGRGIGSHILDKLLKMYPLENGQSWKAFVGTENPKTIKFFKKKGWSLKSPRPNKNGMLTFKLSH